MEDVLVLTNGRVRVDEPMGGTGSTRIMPGAVGTGIVKLTPPERSEMGSLDDARKEIIRWHVVGISDRNPPILSEIEDRWGSLNQAFGMDASLHRYAGRFATLYEPLTKLSSQQCDLGFAATYEQAVEHLSELIEITPRIDVLIASLFKLLAEIEVDCFKRLLRAK